MLLLQLLHASLEIRLLLLELLQLRLGFGHGLMGKFQFGSLQDLREFLAEGVDYLNPQLRLGCHEGHFWNKVAPAASRVAPLSREPPRGCDH